MHAGRPHRLCYTIHAMDDEIAIVRFLASIVNESVAAGGKRLFYVQRTLHNETAHVEQTTLHM